MIDPKLFVIALIAASLVSFYLGFLTAALCHMAAKPAPKPRYPDWLPPSKERKP